MNPIGFYGHIPFCQTKCSYCNFYAKSGKRQHDGFLQAFVRELDKWKKRLPGDTVFSSVYFGGGTPTALSPEELHFLMAAIKDRFAILPGAEIALEANPNTLSPAVVEKLRIAGFWRISLGVQSFVPKELAVLGRKHNNEAVFAAISDAKAAGFTSISADLMLGVPHQTSQSLAKSLQCLTQAEVDHVSAYLLSLEPGTLLYRKQESLNLPTEEETAGFYEQTVATLADAGLAQYEISNFAKPGHLSRHNLAYWTGMPYLGLGPSAHSFMGGKRFAYPDDLDRFVEKSGFAPIDVVENGTGGDLEEHLLLALRLSQGIDFVQTARIYPGFSTACAKLVENATPLVKAGFCVVLPSRLFLTPAGFLLSNACTIALLKGLF